jgi:hypothetical protein
MFSFARFASLLWTSLQQETLSDGGTINFLYGGLDAQFQTVCREPKLFRYQ